MLAPSSRTSPLVVGDLAPSSALTEPDVSTVLAFHDPGWDPARRDAIDGYRALLPSSGDVAPPQPVLLPNDGLEARAFGVEHASAVFVIDEHRRIVWRHIAGIDSIASAAAIAHAAEVGEHGPDVRSDQWSRRGFVATMLGAAVAVALEPVTRRAEAEAMVSAPATTPARRAIGDPAPVTLNVNGKEITLTLEPRVTLLDALREYAGLTGSKKGCDHGQCGACTVHVDGRRVLSCLTFAMMQQGRKITTIEGLAASSGASGDALHPMQQAFIDHDGFQCGYCTSGQIMSAAAVVGEPWGPNDADVREAMSGNLCRCGAYPGILAAVQSVRQNGGQSR